jgi:hypothetical protein
MLVELGESQSWLILLNTTTYCLQAFSSQNCLNFDKDFVQASLFSV